MSLQFFFVREKGTVMTACRRQPSRGHRDGPAQPGLVDRSPYREEETACPSSQAAYEVGWIRVKSERPKVEFPMSCSDASRGFPLLIECSSESAGFQPLRAS